MNLLKISVLGLVAAFAFACAATSPSNNTVSNVAVPPVAPPANTAATPTETASGQKLYLDNCAACHKENGTGGKMEIEGRTIKPDNLTTDRMKGSSDDKLARYINEGAVDEGMPAFKDKLDQTQVAAIIRYIRTDLQKQQALIPGVQ